MYTWQRPSRVKSQGSFFEHVGESSRRRVESFLVFDDDDDVDDDPVESRVKDIFLNMSASHHVRESSHFWFLMMMMMTMTTQSNFRGPHVTHDHPPKKVTKTNQNQD